MADKDMHMAEVVSNDFKPEKAKKMDSTVLDSFTKVTNGNDFVRVDGGVSLLRHLFQQSSGEADSKELKYALTRIIRSLGSSKVSSRKGFYTTLTVFLTMQPETSIDMILSIMDSELHPVNSNSKSENADIYMGRILAYGAFIRSKVLLKADTEMQTKIIQDLINAGKKRSYLCFISVLFLVEFMNQIDIECLKESVWPIIEEEFGKPWSEQNLDTFYVLLVIRDKFPMLVNHKFLKKHLSCEEIISKECIENIVKVLTDLPRIISCHHPVIKLFCEKLVSTEYLTDFWTYIDQKFAKPSKSDAHLALEILKWTVPSITDKSVLPSLLTPHFLQYMLQRYSYCKRHENDEILLDFKNILNMIVSATGDKDIKPKTQISILKKLILYPGELMIEKKTGVKVIQMITGNLNLDGVKKLSKVYRDIIDGTLSKEKHNEKGGSIWTNSERIYAAQLLTRLLGHSTTVTEQDWRLEQFKFLFNHGLCEVPNVGIELAPQLKESFYRSLDHKLQSLNDLRNVLSLFVHHLNTNLKSETLKLRTPLTPEAQEAWEKMIQLIEKLENNPKKTQALPVFHTMNLHMGLQLFSDPEMAIMSINELQSCYERLMKKSKKTKTGADKKENEEPEWVEVVIDLLLSLLSRNSHLLRSLVGCVFPHICPYITPVAIHQILDVLNTRKEKGPLVAKDSDEESSDAESNSDGSNEDEEDNEDEDEDKEMENMSEENDSDSNEESMDEDDDETVTDRVRLAVRQALGDASIQTDDEDIDVDQIDEAEGKRLDESLAAAFRILRENRQSRSKKQEKSAQALTHFRIRVIDLLEAYLDSGPSMAVVFDMLIPLFALLEYCIKDPHQKPLEHRVRSCLKKLSLVKKFKDTEGVNEELLTVVLKALIEKGERTASVCQEMSDKIAESCTFLVRCAQQADLSTDTIVQIYGENLTAFFKKRDCVLPAVLFKSILQLHWEGNWQLAPLLVDFAFDSTVRSFRRGQAIEFLIIFYNNGRLVQADTEHTSTKMMIEKKLCKNTISIFNELCNAHKNANDDSSSNCSTEIGKEVRQRFVCHLLKLLYTVHTQHLPEAWDWSEVGNVLTLYRTEASLAKDAKRLYNKLAARIGISTNVSKKRKNDTSMQNGQTEENNVEEVDDAQENGNTDSEADTSQSTKSEIKKKKKNKNKQKDKQLLKKEARKLREQAMSDGFEPFNFSSVVLENTVDEEETHQNGVSEKEHSNRNSSAQKRALTPTTDIGSKPKRKKHIQTA